MVSNEKMREAFEAWARNSLTEVNDHMFKRMPVLEHMYDNGSVEALWQSWQAATSATHRDAMSVADEVRDACANAARLEGWQAAREQAAKVCDQLETDRFDMFKGRGNYAPDNPGRADSYVNGESDGAGQCANIIRSLQPPAEWGTE